MSFHRLILLLIASSLTQMVDLSAQTTPAGGTATAGGASVSGAGSANPSLTPPDQLDTDGDGLTDWDEVNRTGSDPKEGKADTDGDGVSDLTDGWPRTPWLHPARLPEVRYAVVRLYALGWPTDIMGRETREIDDYCDVLSTPISTHDPHANSFNFRFWNARTCSIETTPWTWVNEGAPHPFSSSDNPYYFPIKRLGRNGHVIDFVNDYSSYLKRAVVWTTGSAAPTQLEPTDYSDSNIGSIASAVDGAGHVVGFRVEYTNDPDPYTGTIYSGGVTFGDTVSWLGGAKITEASSNNGYDWTTSGTDYEPVAINESGLIAASRSIIDYDSGRTPDEILTDPDVGILDGNTFTSLGSGTITAITSGIPVVAVGYTQDYKMWWAHQDTASHAWIRETVQVWNLSTQQLETIPSSYPYGTRINDRLEMLVDGGYIVRNGVIRSLTDLMPSGWSYVGARDINNHGVILANPTRTQDDQGQPIANPQPEPVLLVPAAMEVDENRDGSIDDKDLAANTATTPFRFWSNDDIDRAHTVDGSDSEEDDIGGSEASGKQPDWKSNYIQSKRDLEDFARLQLYTGGLNDSFKNGTLCLGLKWTNVTGTPAIKLYKHVETDGGTKYLTDEATALQQVNADFAIADARDTGLPQNSTQNIIQGTDVFVLPTALFSGLSETQPKTYLLFEGCNVGKGQLQIVILKKDGDNYTEIGNGPGVWMDLKKIDDFYERWTVGDTSGGNPSASAVRQKVTLSSDGNAAGYTTGFAYAANATEEKKYILYVHGWNMQPWEKNRFAETMFKRLYWQGYKGRFGVFCWPTTYSFEPPLSAILDGTSYDRGEWAAWKSATPLKALLADLSSSYGGKVYVMAHSMGNVVTGEALRLQGAGQIVNTYVASQAAIPAHVYDGSRAEDIAPVFGFWTSIGRTFDGSTFPQTPNIYPDWLRGNGAAAGTRVNFYNENDYALWHDCWELNQFFKPDQPDAPDQPWHYSYEDDLGAPPTTHSNFIRFDHYDDMADPIGIQEMQLGTATDVKDRYEIMAFAAESRSKAVGATAGSLTLSDSVNLQTIWPADNQSVKLHNGLNYSAHKWHSAQFRSTNMRQKAYWAELLGIHGFNISTTTP